VIEIAHTLRAKDGGRLRSGGYNVVQAPVPNEYFVVTINARKPPFDNIRVRQAFQHVVDRATIVRNALGGVGKPIVQMVAPGAPGYDPKLDARFAFDLDKARTMLRAAGVNDRLRVKFLSLTSDPALPEIAQIIQSDLKKVGVDAQVDLQDPSTYFPTYFAGNFDLNLTFTTLATLDPTEMTVGSPFRTNATNPSWLETGPPRGYNDAVSKLTASFDERERWGYLREAVRYVLDQSWAVPIAVRLPLFGLGKSVRGFAVDPQMIMMLRTVWLDV
jgi:peptide/nickel transport system substrate-binding protein